MSLWGQVFERAWAMALIAVPVSIPVWASARKTRRRNTQEHLHNARELKRAVSYSRIAAHNSREAVNKVAAVDGRLTGYIEEHKQVHENLRH